MRVLITGAHGMLGRQVEKVFHQYETEVYALSKQELDITSRTEINTVMKDIKPYLVINCAAYTNVDGAEQEREKAFLVNGLGPRFLAQACRHLEAVMIHVSTDYVFSGESKRPYEIYDPTCPINFYGESKLFGEEAIREAGGQYIIIRTSWLYGPGGKNFVDTILNLAANRDFLKVVDDQHGCPTYTVDLAETLAELALAGIHGTFHVTNSGATTWYGLANNIVTKAGLRARVEPCTTDEFPRPARRPSYSILAPFPLAQTIGHLLPPWEDAVERYISEKIL